MRTIKEQINLYKQTKYYPFLSQKLWLRNITVVPLRMPSIQMWKI